ncbi:MAG: hypothetical protein ACK524_16830 [Planctomyces sp.]
MTRGLLHLSRLVSGVPAGFVPHLWYCQGVSATVAANFDVPRYAPAVALDFFCPS